MTLRPVVNGAPLRRNGAPPCRDGASLCRIGAAPRRNGAPLRRNGPLLCLGGALLCRAGAWRAVSKQRVPTPNGRCNLPHQFRPLQTTQGRPPKPHSRPLDSPRRPKLAETCPREPPGGSKTGEAILPHQFRLPFIPPQGDPPKGPEPPQDPPRRPTCRQKWVE